MVRGLVAVAEADGLPKKVCAGDCNEKARETSKLLRLPSASVIRLPLLFDILARISKRVHFSRYSDSNTDL